MTERICDVMKKAGAAAVIAVLALFCMNSPVWATEEIVATVDGKTFGSLQEAINVAVEGESAEAKTVHLQADAVVSDGVTIPQDQYVTLDLNGHGIIRDNNDVNQRYKGVIVLLEDSHLDITDKSRDCVHYYIVESPAENGAGLAKVCDEADYNSFEGTKGTFTGGYITGGKGSKKTKNGNINGGGICAFDGSELHLSGGTIIGNEAEDFGGGVFAKENVTFVMDGGSIIGNHSKRKGGGVCIVDGEFTMNGGQISENVSEKGGGVFLDGYFDESGMSGGSIENNMTDRAGGAGMYVRGDASNPSEFKMDGGVISGNIAARHAGGVRIHDVDFYLYGGSITDNTSMFVDEYEGAGIYLGTIDDGPTKEVSQLYLKGAPVVRGNRLISVSGNKTEVIDQNIYLANDGETTKTEGQKEILVTIAGELELSPKSLGITMQHPGDFVQVSDDYNEGVLKASDAACFVSDDPAYAAVYDSEANTSKLVPSVTVTFKANGAAADDITSSIPSGYPDVLPENAFSRSGYTFKDWNTMADGKGIPYADKAVVTLSENTALYAQWEALAAGAPVITLQPADLTLTEGYTKDNTLSVSSTVSSDTLYGEPVYQWYINTVRSNTGGTAIGGATGASYTVPEGKTAGTTEYYYCTVTATRTDNGESASVASDVATVTIVKPEPEKPDPVNPDPGKQTEERVTSAFSAFVKIKGEILSATVSACFVPTVTYTGKKTDIKNDLKLSMDLSPLIRAVGGDDALCAKADEIISVSYTSKNNLNANAGTSKKSTVYPKLKLSKVAKSMLTKEQKSRLNKLIKAFNKAAKKNRIEYTINPLSLKTCKVEVKVKKTKDGKLNVKNGKLKGVKSVTALRKGDTKLMKLSKKMYDIEVVDAEKGVVKVTGKKNFCDDVESQAIL
ncbi:MAG: InlB B-repeat-containing protein [Lachnospiraceae bacterium]|nr:InlB B-repeat-containing protein [Lachnospiraceae bacterium]